MAYALDKYIQADFHLRGNLYAAFSMATSPLSFPYCMMVPHVSHDDFGW